MRSQPRFLVNVGLLALVVLAGAILYLRPAPSAPESFALLPIAPDDVTRIEIERSNGMQVVLVYGDGRWRMQSPLPARLDEVALERLLDLGRARSSLRMPADDLARFELDKPWARIRYGEHTIELGTSNSITHELYVRSGEHVHVLPARLAANVPADVSKLLAHRLFGPDEQPVAFRLERFTLRRDDDGRWRLEPGTDKPSQDDLLKWVDQWRLASSILTQPQTDAPVRRSIEIALRDGRTIGMRVTALTPDLVVRRDDERLEYHFPARLAAVLLTPPGAAPDDKS